MADEIHHLSGQGVRIAHGDPKPVFTVPDDVGPEEIRRDDGYSKIQELPEHAVIGVEIGRDDTDIDPGRYRGEVFFPVGSVIDESPRMQGLQLFQPVGVFGIGDRPINMEDEVVSIADLFEGMQGYVRPLAEYDVTDETEVDDPIAGFSLFGMSRKIEIEPSRDYANLFLGEGNESSEIFLERPGCEKHFIHCIPVKVLYVVESLFRDSLEVFWRHPGYRSAVDGFRKSGDAVRALPGTFRSCAQAAIQPGRNHRAIPVAKFLEIAYFPDDDAPPAGEDFHDLRRHQGVIVDVDDLGFEIFDHLLDGLPVIRQPGLTGAGEKGREFLDGGNQVNRDSVG
ncbi:MAG: hypothetical protein IH611_09465 [Deltaproteobacteria bacterium]|nr:hypothetical protein [Deltaproteobacteria bacterium]